MARALERERIQGLGFRGHGLTMLRDPVIQCVTDYMDSSCHANSRVHQTKQSCSKRP